MMKPLRCGSLLIAILLAWPGGVLAKISQTGVALFAIDPRGLSSAEGDALELPIQGEKPSVDLSTPTRYGEFAQSIRSLRHLAEATGGFAATDRNDFTGAFERIMDESSNYYMLGSPPANRAQPGEVRRIEVRVARPGVSVVARKMYSGPSR